MAKRYPESAEYQSWKAMKKRCLDRNHRSFADYGGRGITICARWISNFAAFLSDMGARPSRRHTLERRDTNGNYEPGNCRWATKTEQQRNMRNNVRLTFQGLSLCISEWVEKTGIAYQTIRGRLRRGWSIAKTLTTPVG